MIKRIRSSVNLKLICVMSVILVFLISLCIITLTMFSKKCMYAHYNSIRRLITTYSKDCISDYLGGDDNSDEKMNTLAEEFKNISEDEIVDMVYVAVREHSREELENNKDLKDTALVYLLATHESVYHLGNKKEEVNRYELNDYEKDLLDNDMSSTVGKYEARYGQVISFAGTFEYGADGKKEKYIVGINVIEKKLDAQIRTIINKQIILWCIIFILVVGILVFLISRIIVKPIKLVSNRMNNFVENGKIDFSKLEVKGCDEIAMTSQAFNSMAEEINNYVSQVKEYEGEKQKLQLEMTLASQIQMGLLPDEHYVKGNFAVKGFMVPAKNVGGDLYFYQILDEDRIAFAIGDVSGKGISASLFMAAVVTSIKYNLRTCDNPAKLLEAVNNEVIQNNPLKLFVTIFVGIIDVKKKTLVYSNAGHNPPYLVGERIVELSEANGIIIGVFEDEEYENCEIDFSENDTILMYTDGVNEAVNDKNEFFGKNRLEKVLENKSDDIIQNIYDSIQSFTNGAKQNDDITMLAVRLKDDNKKILPAKAPSIKELKEFIMKNMLIQEEFKKKLYLAAEEIFVNIYSYGYPGGEDGTVEISLKVTKSCITICFVDDAKEYNPMENVREEGDYDPDFEIGGLGKYMAFNIMDESTYEYSNGKNMLTMKKYL